jgi:hypothetical protein
MRAVVGGTPLAWLWLVFELLLFLDGNPGVLGSKGLNVDAEGGRVARGGLEFVVEWSLEGDVGRDGCVWV